MTKLRMPVRLVEIELDGDYQGWKFTGKVNPSIGTMEDLTSGDFARIRKGLVAVVYPPWNFVDEQGDPLPEPRPEEPEPPLNGEGEPEPVSSTISPPLLTRALPTCARASGKGVADWPASARIAGQSSCSCSAP